MLLATVAAWITDAAKIEAASLGRINWPRLVIAKNQERFLQSASERVSGDAISDLKSFNKISTQKIARAKLVRL